jgi:hypothetical protein
LGVNFEFENLIFSSEKSTIRVGAFLQNYSNTIYNRYYYNYQGEIYHIEKTNVDLKILVVKVPVTYNYIFSAKAFKPYFRIGFINEFTLTQNKDFVVPLFVGRYGQTFPFYHLGLTGYFGAKYQLKNKHNIFMEVNGEIIQNLNFGGTINIKVTNDLFAVHFGYIL